MKKQWLPRDVAGGLLAGLLMWAACSGGEPAPETQDAADRAGAEAMEEQDTAAEPGPEGTRPAGRTEDEPRTAAGDEPGAPGGAQPESGAAPPAGGAQPQQGAGEGEQPLAGQDTAEGVIAVTGTAIDSRPVLQTADGPLGLTGALTAELRRLSGARVRVQGERREGRMPSEAIDVSSYTVLEVNGERPEVGTIALRDGTTWLLGADTVRLIGASDRLGALDGAKVWVTGRRADDGLEVGSYGVIRR